MLLRTVTDNGEDYVPNPFSSVLSLDSPLSGQPNDFQVQQDNTVLVNPNGGGISIIPEMFRGDGSGFSPASGGGGSYLPPLPVVEVTKKYVPDPLRFYQDSVSAYNPVTQLTDRGDGLTPAVTPTRGDVVLGENILQGMDYIRSSDPVPNSISRNPYGGLVGVTESPKNTENVLGGTTLMMSRLASPAQAEDGLYYFGTSGETATEVSTTDESFAKKYAWVPIVAAMLAIIFYLSRMGD